jgi:hypothetical protein
MLRRHRTATPFAPTNLTGLSLWLKADAGVTLETYTYKSNIALSGAGQTTINGNYAPPTIPQINQNYTIVGPNNNRIEVRPNSSPIYRLYNTDNYIDGGPLYYDFTSNNGTTWSLGDGKRPVSITISGLTGASAIANGTYGSFVGTNDGGVYWIASNSTELGALRVYQNGTCDLLAFISGSFTIVATGSNWGIGSFTIVSPATGSPTGSGTIYPTGGVPTGVVTTTTVNTDNVTTWADQSGNGNNATARTGNSTLVSSVINGKPVLRFDGTANLITNSFFAHNYNTPITIIAVSKASASTVRGEQPTARYIMGVTNNGGYDAGLAYGAYSTENPNFSVGFGISYISGQDIESSPMGENQVGLSSSINSGTLISAFLNGTLVGTADPADQSGGSNSSGEFSIGSEVTLDEIDNFFCTCDIAEIIIYNRQVTTSERQQVEAYLNTKYAIY